MKKLVYQLSPIMRSVHGRQITPENASSCTLPQLHLGHIGAESY